MFPSIFDLNISEQIFFAALFAFLFSVFITSPIIKILRKYKFQDGESVKDNEFLQKMHKEANKAQTPTMGGIAIFISIIISCLLWLKFTSEMFIGIAGALLFFLLGACDDWKKLTKKGKDGLSFRKKLCLQIIISLLIGAGLLLFSDFETKIKLQSLFSIELGWGYLIVILLVLVGSSNAANLTDGLDGLAGGTVAIIAFALTIFGLTHLADYSAFSVIIAGVLGGFLWFNCYPAKLFMGDSGSLTIGYLIGYIAILMKIEILFIAFAGVLVAEAASVMIQVLYYKKTKKRVFLCAPLHHHYQFKGWSENQIVVRFWLVSIILAIITLFFAAYI